MNIVCVHDLTGVFVTWLESINWLLVVTLALNLIQ
jgi:hypothetical protein